MTLTEIVQAIRQEASFYSMPSKTRERLLFLAARLEAERDALVLSLEANPALRRLQDGVGGTT